MKKLFENNFIVFYFNTITVNYFKKNITIKINNFYNGSSYETQPMGKG